jgi:hypothetical protein
VFVDHGHKLQELLGKYAQTGEPFDLQDLFYRFTLDSIGKIAFGTDLGWLVTVDDTCDSVRMSGGQEPSVPRHV